MKMAKNRKRIIAVVLALMMALSLIPAAAVSAAVSPSVITSGESITVNYTAGYSYTTDQYIPIWDSTTQTTVKNYYGKLTINNIDGLYACEYDMGATIAGIVKSDTVSVYPTTSASYNVTSLKDNMNAALKAKAAADGSSYYTVPSFSAYQKDYLSKANVYYYGTETYKNVYLYAAVTPYTYTFSSTSSYYPSAVAGETTYVRVGSVTLYSASRSSFDLSLSKTYGSIATGQSVALIATVDGAANVKYVATADSVSGIASINQVSPGVFMITANDLVTSGNRITITAYLMDDTGANYVYRSTSGAQTTSSTLQTSITIGSVKYYPVYDYAIATYSTVSPITSIVFGQTSYACEVGDTLYTSVTVRPVGASGGVTYTSSNPAVATVSSSGAITGVGVGSAAIYATANDGSGVMAVAYVTVTASTATLTIDKTSVSLEVGQTETVKATVVTALSNKAVSWTSSNTSVATVSGGVITAKGAGSAVISAIYAGTTNKRVYCYVTVTEPTAVITVDKDVTVEVGEKVNINASISDVANKTLIYSVDKQSIAKVDANGNVAGVKAGVTMVTVTSAANSTIKAYCVVNVVADDDDKGVIEKTGRYVKNSKYYWTKSISSAEVKAAIAELKGEDDIDVTVNVNATSNMNKVIFTRYAIARLAKYADSLTVVVNGTEYEFDSADLAKMNNGRPVYVYTTTDSVSVKYKNAAGAYKTVKGVTVEVDD